MVHVINLLFFGSYCCPVKAWQAVLGFFLIDSLHPSQQFFSYVGTGFPGLNLY